MGTKNSGWRKAALNFLLVIPSIYNIATHLISYVEYETRMAKKGLITLFILSACAIVMLTASWFCLCAIIFLALIKSFSTILVLSLFLIVHLILLFLIGFSMAKAKNKLLFTHTRNLFH